MQWMPPDDKAPYHQSQIHGTQAIGSISLGDHYGKWTAFAPLGNRVGTSRDRAQAKRSLRHGRQL
jgi:hypothetical protein